jgi:hypothetical protein
VRTTAVLAGLVLPIAASVAVIRAAVPELWLRSRTLVIGLGAVAGLASSSLLLATLLFAFESPHAFYVPLDIALWIVVFIAAMRASRGRAAEERAAMTWTRLEVGAGLVFVATLTLSLLHFYMATLASPSGEWDAWSVWNLRARFLHRGLAGHWREAFDSAMHWSNLSNPLLLPSSTARLWLYARAETAAAPALLSFVFIYATAAILVGAFIAAGRRLEGFLAGGVLLATYPFNFWGPAQMADVPLAAFVLAGTVMMSRMLDNRSDAATPAIALLTFCAGCAAWTKNEGLVFAAASCAVAASVVALQRPRVFRGVMLALAGLAWPIAVVLYFKLRVGPTSYLLEGVTMWPAPPQVWHLERHLYILRAFARELLAWGTRIPVGIIPVVVFYAVAASMAFGFRRRHLIAALPLLTMLVGGYVAFLLTPLNLQWHLETALPRVVLQIWPAALYVLFSLPAPIAQGLRPAR